MLHSLHSLWLEHFENCFVVKHKYGVCITHSLRCLLSGFSKHETTCETNYITREMISKRWTFKCPVWFTVSPECVTLWQRSSCQKMSACGSQTVLEVQIYFSLLIRTTWFANFKKPRSVTLKYISCKCNLNEKKAVHLDQLNPKCDTPKALFRQNFSA